MNPLRPVSAIGCPIAGVALNDQVLVDGVWRAVAQRPAGATVGPAVIIRHPAAPGANRNAAQQAIDATKNYHWRDYGLAIGHTRSINGADGGVGIGRNRWLYCDASGATWLIRMQVSVLSSSAVFEIWLDGLFGRFGRQYEVPQRLLASMEWTPDLPSWTRGGITAATVIGSLFYDSINTIAFSEDGSLVYINLFAGGTVANEEYLPTSRTGHNWGLLTGASLCGVLRVNISGSSTPEQGGAAIAATIQQDLAYEGGLVASFNHAGLVKSHEAILYKSPYGTVDRVFFMDFSASPVYGQVTVTAFGKVMAINGEPPAPDYSSMNEVTVFAQNAVYVCAYKKSTLSNVFYEWWACTDENNAGWWPWTQNRADTWVAPSSGYSEMPYLRNQVFTYDPGGIAGVTIDQNTYLTAYTGDTFQVV